ncbi:MAG: hypothetical protein Q8R02_12885 [Hyphomonadaceae bacterium]|nr:hypothetical protein [Hyphomonadaceae bacterium]
MPTMRIAILSFLAIMLCDAASAQQTDSPLRTTDGHPDFHGVWTNRWTTPLERMAPGPLNISEAEGEALHSAFLARLDAANPLGVRARDLTGPVVVRGQARSSLIVDPPDGLIPYTAEGRARRSRIGANGTEGDEGPERRNGTERCLISGNGHAPFLSQPANNNRQIVQTRDHVVIFTESYNQLRIIPLDGTSGPVLAWGGSSAGRWEGDTLVVETRGFSEGDRLRNASGGTTFPITPRTLITERFTRTGPDEVLYRFSIDDPVLYSQVWTGESVFARSSERLFEFACHEGNYSMANILGGARITESRAAAKAKP